MAKIFARAIPRKISMRWKLKVHWHDSAMHINFVQDAERKVPAGHAETWRPGASCVPGRLVRIRPLHDTNEEWGEFTGPILGSTNYSS